MSSFLQATGCEGKEQGLGYPCLRRAGTSPEGGASSPDSSKLHPGLEAATSSCTETTDRPRVCSTCPAVRREGHKPTRQSQCLYPLPGCADWGLGPAGFQSTWKSKSSGPAKDPASKRQIVTSKGIASSSVFHPHR